MKNWMMRKFVKGVFLFILVFQPITSASELSKQININEQLIIDNEANNQFDSLIDMNFWGMSIHHDVLSVYNTNRLDQKSIVIPKVYQKDKFTSFKIAYNFFSVSSIIEKCLLTIDIYKNMPEGDVEHYIRKSNCLTASKYHDYFLIKNDIGYLYGYTDGQKKYLTQIIIIKEREMRVRIAGKNEASVLLDVLDDICGEILTLNN